MRVRGGVGGGGGGRVKSGPFFGHCWNFPPTFIDIIEDALGLWALLDGISGEGLKAPH